MGKKHREPEPEKSAFENAKAAFERAGEEDIPAMKTAEPSKAADAPANPEPPVPETETPASDSATPDSDSGGDAEATPSGADSDTPDTTESDTDADTPEADADGVEADATEADSDETPASGADGDAPDSDDAESAEEYGDDEDDFPDDTGPEVTEMETHTMETKEITLGYHRSQHADADTRPYETQADKEPKAKIQFKAFDKLKDAFRVQEEQADEARTAAGSARDAALRKRVMQIEDGETRNYLLDRVLPQMAWYSTKSAQYQAMYYRLMGATILLGALIPAFAVGANNSAVKVILALLGASVTGLNAYIALHNYHDLWITYRTTREDLIHHLYCYFNHAGAFSSAEDLDVLLVNVCEDTMSKEHGGWTTILQKT
ncbi:MAG: DUF4231 domain-containing protein [Oscillibacter sp.]|nr:DUF4231 domain-containing protein [Oscillibacter sp.]